MISSPSTDRDVQQELIAEIHRTAIWPVVVTVHGNISKHTETDFIDRDGSYIILITDGNLKRFKVEILGLAMLKHIDSHDSGILKLGLLWLEQIITQFRNKRTYLNIFQNLEYITAL